MSVTDAEHDGRTVDELTAGDVVYDHPEYDGHIVEQATVLHKNNSNNIGHAVWRFDDAGKTAIVSYRTDSKQILDDDGAYATGYKVKAIDDRINLSVKGSGAIFNAREVFIDWRIYEVRWHSSTTVSISTGTDGWDDEEMDASDALTATLNVE